MSFIDEVQSYFQVRIDEVDTDVYAAAHDEISSICSAAPDRWPSGWRPSGRPRRARRNWSSRRCAPSPPPCASGSPDRPGWPTCREHIDFEIARDVAWSGFNYYLGGFASRVAVNADIGHRMSQFGVLVAHECYPGHHTEHCRKEDLLVNRGGQAEHTIFLVNTPQCLMAEGLGDLALTAAVGPAGGGGSPRCCDGWVRRPGVRPGPGGGPRGRVPAAEHRPAERRHHAARPGVDPEDVDRLPAALVDGQRGTGPATTAVHDRSAVAGLHLDLCRG